jgi:hypothetical protein
MVDIILLITKNIKVENAKHTFMVVFLLKVIYRHSLHFISMTSYISIIWLLSFHQHDIIYIDISLLVCLFRQIVLKYQQSDIYSIRTQVLRCDIHVGNPCDEPCTFVMSYPWLQSINLQKWANWHQNTVRHVRSINWRLPMFITTTERSGVTVKGVIY